MRRVTRDWHNCRMNEWMRIMIDSSEIKDEQGTRRQATKQEAVGPWVTLFTTYMNVFHG